MSITREMAAAFGTSNSGLSVTYRLFNSDNTSASGVISTGIVEIGSSGTYVALVTLAVGFQGYIVWTTSGGAVAVEPISPTDANITGVNGYTVTGTGQTGNTWGPA